MTKHWASRNKSAGTGFWGMLLGRAMVVPFLGPKYGDVYFQCLSQASPAGKTKLHDSPYELVVHSDHSVEKLTKFLASMVI